MIDEQPWASEQDYASDHSAIGAGAGLGRYIFPQPDCALPHSKEHPSTWMGLQMFCLQTGVNFI